ncbi:MAG TPA: prepilin-type N-terminal cleavage/methylation domain-containing protein [Verrucomicrobiae bacterium]|jgi:prepilin-type N-terminal cleavage/methylation domain-containing protein|nr:prepilin-type N-terminal cleavage/methylation domain-containing protein [Verrucomicrobiae bacterium]
MHRRSPEPLNPLPPRTGAHACQAFTLIEMLVVIAIIGILATIGLPAIKGMTKSNATIAANRQLLDDFTYARQRAIADHTSVYVVFDPPTILNFTPTKLTSQASAMHTYTNLLGGQYTTYALLSLRSVGDQPGQTSPHYLTAWRSLPQGIFIAASKFSGTTNAVNFYTNAFRYAQFPFPTIDTNSTLTTFLLPYVGFDYQGQLISQVDEAIPLSRGSILYPRDADGNFISSAPDVLETPPGNSITTSNVIHIDWLTGRAHIERQEVQ